MKVLLLPVLLLAGLVLIVAVWIWIGPIVAFLAFAGVASLGGWLAKERVRRERGLPRH